MDAKASFFGRMSSAERHQKLLKSFVVLIETTDPQKMKALMLRLGERHASLGVVSRHFNGFITTLLELIKSYCADRWDGAHRTEWVDLITAVAQEIMKAGNIQFSTSKDLDFCEVALPSDSTALISDIKEDEEMKEHVLIQEENSALLLRTFGKISSRLSWKQHFTDFVMNAETTTDQLQCLKLIIGGTDSGSFELASQKIDSFISKVYSHLQRKDVGQCNLLVNLSLKGCLAGHGQKLLNSLTSNNAESVLDLIRRFIGTISIECQLEHSLEESAMWDFSKLFLRAMLQSLTSRPSRVDDEILRKCLENISAAKLIAKQDRFTSFFNVGREGLSSMKSKLTWKTFKQNLEARIQGFSSTFWALPSWAVALFALVLVSLPLALFADSEIVQFIQSNLDSFSLIAGVIWFIKEYPDRRKESHYQAWTIIDSAKDSKMSYARNSAMEDLCSDGVPMKFLKLCDKRLDNLKLQRSDFTESDFERSLLQGSDFSSGRLDYVNFSSADLSRCNLRQCSCNFSNFTAANLSHSSFKEAVAMCGDFTGANLTGVDFSGAQLTGAVFKNARVAP
eukprot:TRINITY_DN8265_c0_g1_i1.p1 TRINITY_DN8265_c0_g1~~TRINITY_DN8265_c0_g1_i1.p1  ORF type:complete len:626 (+),score=153.93 TRINITY_DN8265_c0_g1_i1:182-1879(+)